MTISEIELNVLKVMAGKDIDWSWMVLDRTLAVNKIPGFSNVAKIVNSLVDEGLVNVVDNDNASKPRYRVSKKGFDVVETQQLKRHL